VSAAHDALHALESMGVIECVKRESLVIQQHATAYLFPLQHETRKPRWNGTRAQLIPMDCTLPCMCKKGIRKFASDIGKLEKFVARKINYMKGQRG
jgi:hypothetical protein